MNKRPSDISWFDRQQRRLDRRQFLRLSLAAAATALLPPALETALAGRRFRDALPERPNLLIITSDQERHPRHWPTGWAEANLPARNRLLANGLSFERAYCNASMCSPSRACLFTGLHPAQHGVVRTLTYGGSISDEETPLSADIENMATMLARVGYNVQLRGKWHLSKSASGGEPEASDLEALGFNGWVPTTTGEAIAPENYGGGCANGDETITDQAVAFLQTQTPAGTAENPFALIVSFGNPHDVLGYPADIPEDACGGDEYAMTVLDENYDSFTVPNSFATDDLSTKPTVQDDSRTLYAAGLGALNLPLERQRYVRFYAYLHTLVDAQIGRVLDALDAAGLTESTVIVRTADHGEMGLAHGGLRQKMFNMYEETMNVPLIVSNPLLFTEARTTRSLASLVDIVPTLASLCGVSWPSWKTRGQDLTPIFADPLAEVQSTLYFTFDDQEAGQGEPLPDWFGDANHIRAVVRKDAEGTWKYARYFDPAGVAPEEFEMYLARDASGAEPANVEEDNLANAASANYDAYAAKRAELAALLAKEEQRRERPVAPPMTPILRMLTDGVDELGEEKVVN